MVLCLDRRFEGFEEDEEKKVYAVLTVVGLARPRPRGRIGCPRWTCGKRRKRLLPTAENKLSTLPARAIFANFCFFWVWVIFFGRSRVNHKKQISTSPIIFFFFRLQGVIQDGMQIRVLRVETRSGESWNGLHANAGEHTSSYKISKGPLCNRLGGYTPAKRGRQARQTSGWNAWVGWPRSPIWLSTAGRQQR